VAAEQPDEGSCWHPGDAENSGTHRVDIGPDLIIRKSHHVKSHPFEVASSIAITDLAFVLRTVDFNDKLRFKADEISNVAAFGTLPSKLQAIEFSVAQSPPQCPLNAGRMRTHLTGRATQKLAKTIIRHDD
jgi:hypothetical protein